MTLPHECQLFAEDSGKGTQLSWQKSHTFLFPGSFQHRPCSLSNIQAHAPCLPGLGTKGCTKQYPDALARSWSLGTETTLSLGKGQGEDGNGSSESEWKSEIIYPIGFPGNEGFMSRISNKTN